MAEGEPLAVGLSIGATNLAAVTADRAVVRKSVLTLYRQRPPEVGVPSGDSEQQGLVMTDFIDRVGDPVGVVAADGSTHGSEALVVDGLRALAYAVTNGSARAEVVAVTHPAHWRHSAVDALRAALSRVSEWSGGRLSLLSDSVAALTALQADSGLPSRGIIAVCDFGGSGTSLTLVDAANGYRAVGPTVRHTDFAGDRIDQALLDEVVADLSSAGDTAGTSATSAIDSLIRLRTACRRAKEELSSTTETSLTAELPSFRGDVRITRTELDDAIRQPLNSFVTVVRETLQRRGLRAADVVAAASVGGGASIPAVTRTLIEHLRVPVITTPHPQLAPAVGAALRATRGPADNSETGLAATAAAEVGSSLADPKTVMEIPPESDAAFALAWSEVDDDSGIMPFLGEHPEPGSDDEELTYGAWRWRPEVVLVGVLLVVVIILAVIMIALRHTPGGAPTTPTTSVSSTPSPASRTPTETSTTTEAPDTHQAPAPPPETITQPPPPPPPPETTTQPPPPPPPPPTTQPTPEVPSTTQAPTRVQPPRTPQYPPTNPFKPRDPSLPNPFAPRNPFAPANPGFSQFLPELEIPAMYIWHQIASNTTKFSLRPHLSGATRRTPSSATTSPQVAGDEVVTEN